MAAETRTPKMRPPFPALHAATLAPGTTGEILAHLLREADAMPVRRRLSEGAVYMSAQRRFKMLTGADWRDAQQPEDAASWSGSAHTLRVRAQVYPQTGVVWGCSCGDASGLADDETDAGDQHSAHLHALEDS
jgi:hypothetical protein